MPACCARSASTARKPISTPTCRRITTSISRTTTSWSTFPIRTSCSRRCRKCLMATRSPASTWSCGCARSAEGFTPLVKSSWPGLSRPSTFLAPRESKTWMSGTSPGMTTSNYTACECSLHLLVGVDAPQPLLFDPAIKTVAGDAAPPTDAFLHLRHHAGLQTRGNRAVRIGSVVERREVVPGFHGDDRGAAARQHRVVDPALRAFGIAHPAPVLEFGGDLDR